jgi:cytochrome b6-f complex iron-sulfur subunit
LFILHQPFLLKIFAMKRRQFFSLLGLGTASVVVGDVLVSCTKELIHSNATPVNVDFNIDLSNQNNLALKSVGGSIVVNSIIVVQPTLNNFIALSDICTHQACGVGYDSAMGRFLCPCHGSIYALDGSVIQGPAPRALTRYNTTLTGNLLRVYQ